MKSAQSYLMQTIANLEIGGDLKLDITCIVGGYLYIQHNYNPSNYAGYASVHTMTTVFVPYDMNK